MGLVLNQAEVVKLDSLSPHPRNYRAHPEDQLQHIEESLKEHGLYRNVVVARDNTVLAGHGVVLAARRLGWEEISVVRLDLGPEDPRALKVLTGDNELSRRAEVDDRLLSELLKDIQEMDTTGLLGTGYDEMMLANLLFVTRPAHEIKDLDAAAQWAGMPDWDADDRKFNLQIHFDSEAERQAFAEESNIRLTRCVEGSKQWSASYPDEERTDRRHVRYMQEPAE